jgi:hypothetical protein
MASVPLMFNNRFEVIVMVTGREISSQYQIPAETMHGWELKQLALVPMIPLPAAAYE